MTYLNDNLALHRVTNDYHLRSHPPLAEIQGKWCCAYAANRTYEVMSMSLIHKIYRIIISKSIRAFVKGCFKDSVNQRRMPACKH